MADSIDYYEFSLVIPKSQVFQVHEALGSIIGWMISQDLNPVARGVSSRLESGAIDRVVVITAGSSSMALPLYGDFNPRAFAHQFGFNVHEDEVHEDGDFCIRTQAADNYLATGARSMVLVQR